MHLSIILVINQINAQNFCFKISSLYASTYRISSTMCLSFAVLLTVHLSIILVSNQLNVQNLVL